MDEKTIAGQPAQDVLCPIRYMLDIFGGKWKLPIVCILSRGEARRYSSIRRKLGNVTNVMLSQSLKELEAAGVVHREQYNEVPPRVEYSLTDKGRDVLPSLLGLAKWAAHEMQEADVCIADCESCVLTS